MCTSFYNGAWDSQQEGAEFNPWVGQGAFQCEVCKLFFPWGTSDSSHNPKTSWFGRLAILNCWMVALWWSLLPFCRVFLASFWFQLTAKAMVHKPSAKHVRELNVERLCSVDKRILKTGHSEDHRQQVEKTGNLSDITKNRTLMNA